MTTSDFTTTIEVGNTPEEVFNAINNVRRWWSEGTKGSTDKVGDEFVHQYRDVHKCTLKIIESVPGEKVVWFVVDNYFNFIKDKTEWTGTKIIFEISEIDGKTELRFTHLGLVPEYECYDLCFDAWTSYINDSLYSLITTGEGNPEPLDS